ncbi:MAG: DUF86 domain-containing protein, partial [Chloroflexi bacterium]|nr:DUF86 domain-containing protein [Chloroflexota bacterium]
SRPYDFPRTIRGSCNIQGARNRLAHAYLGIDDDVVWDIIRTDIPKLIPRLRRLLDMT